MHRNSWYLKIFRTEAVPPMTIDLPGIVRLPRLSQRPKNVIFYRATNSSGMVKIILTGLIPSAVPYSQMLNEFNNNWAHYEPPSSTSMRLLVREMHLSKIPSIFLGLPVKSILGQVEDTGYFTAHSDRIKIRWDRMCKQVSSLIEQILYNCYNPNGSEIGPNSTLIEHQSALDNALKSVARSVYGRGRFNEQPVKLLKVCSMIVHEKTR